MKGKTIKFITGYIALASFIFVTIFIIGAHYAL